MSSQTHQPAAWPLCPSCSEPLEEGDRYCGACGHDLSTVPPPPGGDRPTLPIGHPLGPPPGNPLTDRAPEYASGWPGTAPAEPAPVPQAPGAPFPGTVATPHPAPVYARETPPGGYAVHDHPPGPFPPSGPPGDPRGLPYPPPPAADSGTGAYGPGAYGSGDADAPPLPPRTDPRAAEPAYAGYGWKVCVACRTGRVDTDGYCENCGHAQPRERDHMEQELGAVAAVSDRGLRHHRNEDAFAVSNTSLPDGSPAVIAVVSDGVSSATRPDEASQAAVRAANEVLLDALPRGVHPQRAMREAIVAAGTAVNALAGRDPLDDSLDSSPRQLNAPACTIVGAVSAGGLLTVGWVGDSRVYWVPEDRTVGAARLTEDDSWAAQMVAAGLMGEAEAYADERAHAITGWLGADAYELDPHTAVFQPDHPGVVVVCTDGLWNYAEGAEEMARAIPADAADRPLHCAQVLVGHALDGGGHDNVTVAVVPFAVARQGAGSAYDAQHRV
ncbi:protein phosphatase 2C domain-containing protein [Streptomyces sp. NPDC057638]|uniref:protein phosphatase 2C domain-containing protein n=1 Tax=Streptomyces sp. NPDC057638 TaxID=3346190 RepID=UPI0036C64885